MKLEWKSFLDRVNEPRAPQCCEDHLIKLYQYVSPSPSMLLAYQAPAIVTTKHKQKLKPVKEEESAKKAKNERQQQKQQEQPTPKMPEMPKPTKKKKKKQSKRAKKACRANQFVRLVSLAPDVIKCKPSMNPMVRALLVKKKADREKTRLKQARKDQQIIEAIAQHHGSICNSYSN